MYTRTGQALGWAALFALLALWGYGLAHPMPTNLDPEYSGVSHVGRG